jgi:CheY-like chemotaxis protein
MVLVAVDDLLFSSKIRTTAKQAGVDLTFARSPQEILDQVKAQNPSLVIFDLNSAKTDPVATIAALKRDPALSALRVLAFASHVHTELIEAGRNAGADQVLPRSAFAAHLAEILLSSQSAAPDHTH